ncbi:DUF4132 domain-containing protein [Proteus vulgaris]|uniref:DUF4132 domain-containing protein n=1 Tax=Proteus vulgaris TaxID=585 RepID=UPI0025406A02|nr:DUF4132 domain-containing protein [Proteus vulgaris]WIF73321.1 DUF4132 domain-containing protein [Proteus vulgaris]
MANGISVAQKNLNKKLAQFSNENNLYSIEISALIQLEDTPLPDSTYEIIITSYQALLKEMKQKAIEEKKWNKHSSFVYKEAQENYDALSQYNESSLKNILIQLNSSNGILNKFDCQIITYENGIPSSPEFTLFHLIRSLDNDPSSKYISSYTINDYGSAHIFEHIELRHIEEILIQRNYPNASRIVADFFLGQYGIEEFLRSEQIWPFYYQHPEYIAEALKLIPNQGSSESDQFSLDNALRVLETYPIIPSQFVPKILQLALGDTQIYRFDAQKLIEKLPEPHLFIQEGLISKKKNSRIIAINWLIELNNHDAVPALVTLLKTENDEVVRTLLITALEHFGEDISDYLDPLMLLAEAEIGLKNKIPDNLAWFDFNTLPQLTWKNNKTVEPRIIQWWIVLAVKLKLPASNALLHRYINLLSLKSQQTLAQFLLIAFITQDVDTPSEERIYLSSGVSYSASMSAIKEKGMLGLIFPIEGYIAVPLLRNYMRDHYERRAQIEAMIDAIGGSNDPIIIQFLLSISRRYRAASIQTKARQLITQIAQRNNWTEDELADRTIPTAGLDDSGVLTLDYGERTFTAKINDKLQFVLFNTEGKVIKALPAPRVNEDSTLIKETKKHLTSSKKELKQIIESQTLRLYEAMCVQRQWLSTDWQEFLQANPIMHKLMERLIWQEIKNDKIINTFRPSNDGALLNIEDEEITLQSDSSLRLAHCVFLNKKEKHTWLAHFQDYKVRFLFNQLEHDMPILEDKQTQFAEKKGWLTDAYTLRSTMTKLGYQRGSVEDAGFYNCYHKYFSGLDLSVIINFSGNCVSEENVTVALLELVFEKGRQSGLDRHQLAIKNIPPILLAESYAEYLKIADACAGFSSDWEKKLPW